MSKEANKVPVLEEEIESLGRFETELDDVNFKCDRLVQSDAFMSEPFYLAKLYPGHTSNNI